MAAEPADEWQRLNRVLDPALELPLEQRAAFLDRACAGDPALRTRAERLLQACQQAEHFLDEPAPLFAASLLEHSVPESIDPTDVGMQVGPYRLVRELGHGGMGAVYLAERADDQFRHRVALKLIRRGMDNHAIRRFMEERQILASLSHPNIARLLDGGVTGDRLPYFAMEYVEGTRIDHYCDTRRLAVTARLDLFVRVCQAVQYAHRNLIVHRDLKPSNILVADDGQVKLLDFGIAKLLATREPRTELTQPGIRLMTPEYASPEQVRGDPISTASDVYALGVLLYELLTGHHPYGAPGQYDVHRAILEQDPPCPSVAVSRTLTPEGGVAVTPARVSDARNSSIDKLRRALRGDLDTIVLRAMTKEPERRYATAEQLAADIERHRAGLPVVARRDTHGYRAQKFVRRHPFSVAAVAAFVLLLVGFSAVATIQSARLRAEAERVRSERDKAQQVTGFLTEMFNMSDPLGGRGNALRAREVLDAGAARIERDLNNQPELQAQLMKTVGGAYYGLGLYGPARQLLTSALALRQATHGEDDPEVSSTMNVLALVLLDDGDYRGAEDMYRRTLAVRRRTLGARDARIARTLNGLGLVLRAKGDFEAAEALLREALVIDREGSPNPVGLSQSLNNLGRVIQDHGDATSAESLHREALDLRTAWYGTEHRDVAVSQVNLATTLVDQGRLAAAQALFREALRIQRQVMGEEHADVAATIGEFARAVLLAGDPSAAEGLYRESLERQRRAFGASHPRLPRTLVGLGGLLLDAGDAKAAEPLLQEASTIALRAFGLDHWQTGEAQAALGAAMSALGREADARRLLLSGYATLERTRGPNHRQTQVAHRWLIAHDNRWSHPTRPAR
jgi:serine/threonine-protein kinase